MELKFHESLIRDLGAEFGFPWPGNGVAGGIFHIFLFHRKTWIEGWGKGGIWLPGLGGINFT